MKYRLYIFDMDGTILNTLDDLTECVNYALTKNGYPLHTTEAMRTFVGNGIRKMIERAVPADLAPEQIDAVHRDFSGYYQIHCTDKTRPYNGIVELLRALHAAGAKTAVVSNKADYAVQDLCTKFFDGLFDCAVGERDGLQKKPAPDSVNYVLNKLCTQKKDAVYIGDSEVDIATAANSELDMITVNWGFRDSAFLKEHGAARIVSAPSEVLDI